MRPRWKLVVGVALLGALVVACDSSPSSVSFETAETTIAPTPASTADTAAAATAVDVTIDVAAAGQEISPLILGVSSTLTPEEMADAGVTLNSSGGNPATRYNYVNGHAWNNGADYEFRNTNYGFSGDAIRQVLTSDDAAGVQTRLAIPTLGWVAKDDDPETCSFPDGAGGCLPAAEVGSCDEGRPIADPATANVESTPEGVQQWVEGLVADGLAPEIIAMDNEPELWGSTHYDVHPTCPTYEEILDKYLTYARLIREVAPDARLAGPVICCWYDYWETAPGPEDGSGAEYLQWFLEQVKAHDDEAGIRTLDLVDVHFYPQSDVFNDNTDEPTNARRLRSTRALWDPTYVDESWIDEPIEFLPRMRETIDQSYPGTPLLVSEWNFGAEETMNGALAIADTLGIFGREGVDSAAYWRHPDVASHGWFAFKMHGNYDGEGARFVGTSVPAATPNPDTLGAFATIDGSVLKVMLINKRLDESLAVTLGGVAAAGEARSFTYSEGTAGAIESATADVSAPITLAPYSITVLEIPIGS